MAITAIEYALFTYFKQNGGLPTKPHVLELGEANWFGDLPTQQLVNDINALVTDEPLKNKLLAELNATIEAQNEETMRNIARIFYSTFLDFETLTAIDPHGSKEALALDLNQPIKLDQQYDLCLDFGTAENVFNTHQFFQTAHQLTKPGGVMVHGTSLSGWHDQGFYSFKPSFYWGLAKKNDYQIMAFVYAELQPLKILELNSPEDFTNLAHHQQIAADSLLYIFLRKADAETHFAGGIQ